MPFNSRRLDAILKYDPEGISEQPCVGFFGWLYGHNFRAVYNKEEEMTPESVHVANTLKGMVYMSDIVRLAETAKKMRSTYVTHICSRCGKTAKDIEQNDKEW